MTTDPQTADPVEPDNPAAYALARHIADHPVSTIQAAFRYLNAPLTIELHAVPAVSSAVPATTTQAAAPADWIDGHPQLEAMAAAVWEQCGRSDSGSCVEDDPRNIAVAALAAVVLPPPADRATLSGRVARAVAEDASALRMNLYDDLAAFARETGNPGLQHAQIRDHLAEFLFEGLLRRLAAETAGPETQGAPEAEDPARVDRLRPEFTEHASIESIDAQLRRAHSQQRRWHLRVEWLISLRQARVDQKARGEWPADGRCAACGHTVCDGDGPCGARSGDDFCTCPGPAAAPAAVQTEEATP